jgi:PTS system N-acetylgalactosamine-specific IIA component
MRYLLLVSHGTMAPGVHSVIRMLLGDRDNVLSYSMEDGVSADAFVEKLREVIAPITADDSVVVLGDIMGGSPLTNTLNTLTEQGLLAKTIAFGGLSLPMAISALMAIEDGLDDETLVQNVITEAKEGVRKVELALDDDDEDEEDL